MHVTLRRANDLPNLRTELLHRLIKKIVREVSEREGFRIVHYSVQADHVHLIIEAEDDAALSKGMRSFAIRVAKQMNRDVLRRRGPVWGDRYHRRDLGSPRQVRHALVYVLANGVKHGAIKAGDLDPCSSARWFDGYATRRPDTDPSPTKPPNTWLLETGWSKLYPGFILPTEVPKAARD